MVVTADVVVTGLVVMGVLASDEDEPDAEPLEDAVTTALPDADEADELVVPAGVAVVAVVEVDVVEVTFAALPASNGSRVRLVGVVR